MGKIAYEAQKSITSLISDIYTDNFRSYLFLYLIAQGQFAATLENIKQLVLPEQQHPDIQEMKQREPFNHTWEQIFYASDLPHVFGVKALAHLFAFRQRIDGTHDLFSFQDISNYLALVEAFFITNVPKRIMADSVHPDYFLWDQSLPGKKPQQP